MRYAGFWMRLRPLAQAGEDIASRREHIACVVEQHSTQVLPDVRQSDGRGSNFKVVEKQAIASERKSCFFIARSSLVEAKAAMRVAAAGKKPFRKRYNTGNGGQ